MVDAYLHPSGGSSAAPRSCRTRRSSPATTSCRTARTTSPRRSRDGMTGTPGGVNDELITNAGVNPADTTQNGTPSRTRSWTATDLKNSLLGSRARPRLPRRPLQRQRRSRGRLHIRPHDDAAEGVEHELPQRDRLQRRLPLRLQHRQRRRRRRVSPRRSTGRRRSRRSRRRSSPAPATSTATPTSSSTASSSTRSSRASFARGTVRSRSATHSCGRSRSTCSSNPSLGDARREGRSRGDDLRPADDEGRTCR